jgi:hypothetical protein
MVRLFRALSAQTRKEETASSRNLQNFSENAIMIFASTFFWASETRSVPALRIENHQIEIEHHCIKFFMTIPHQCFVKLLRSPAVESGIV